MKWEVVHMPRRNCTEGPERSKEKVPDMYTYTDVCMCEYTSHGHCGVLCGHDVDNDATLELLAKTAAFPCRGRCRYGSTI